MVSYVHTTINVCAEERESGDEARMLLVQLKNEQILCIRRLWHTNDNESTKVLNPRHSSLAILLLFDTRQSTH